MPQITFQNWISERELEHPKKILHHITGVLTYAHSFFEHYDTTFFDLRTWNEEVEAFYRILSKLDNSFKENSPNEVTLEQLLQGPLSDTMAHIGQLLMLRRMAGLPIPSENFLYADIKKGLFGPNQPEPVAPDR